MLTTPALHGLAHPKVATLSMEPRLLPRPRARRRAFPLRAIVSLGLAGALSLGGAGAAIATSMSLSLTSTQVLQNTAVSISGTKSAESTVVVELRPPRGGGWQSVTAACAGVQEGSTAWSCRLSSGSVLGDHHLRATETSGSTRTVVGNHFVVVPPAVQHAAAAPEPDPEPEPEPEPEPKPKPEPGPNPPPADKPTSPGTETERAPETERTDERTPREPTPAPTDDARLDLPTESLAERATPERTVDPTLAPTDRNDPATPSALSSGMITLATVWRDPFILAVAGGIGALFLLLVAIPAEILNSTLERNAHRWRWMYAWSLPLLARLRRALRVMPAWTSSPAVVIILTSIAFGFADPQFGFDLTSLRLVASLAIGLILVVHLPQRITAALLGRRWHVSSAIITQPGAIVIAVLGVLASRMLDFSPGLLIGLVLGLELASTARREDHQRAIVTRMLVTLAIALLAWLGYSWLDGAIPAAEANVASVFVIETLIATVHEGLTGLLVALLPLAFLDGKDLFDADKRVWVALAGPTAVAFALLVLPTSETLDDGAPLLLWIAVFVAFCLVVAAVWFSFRILESRDTPDSGAADRSPAHDAVSTGSRP